MVKFVLETAVNQFRFAGRKRAVKFITEPLENLPLFCPRKFFQQFHYLGRAHAFNLQR